MFVSMITISITCLCRARWPSIHTRQVCYVLPQQQQIVADSFFDRNIDMHNLPLTFQSRKLSWPCFFHSIIVKLHLFHIGRSSCNSPQIRETEETNCSVLTICRLFSTLRPSCLGHMIRLTFDRKVNPEINNANSDTFAIRLPILTVSRTKLRVHSCESIAAKTEAAWNRTRRTDMQRSRRNSAQGYRHGERLCGTAVLILIHSGLVLHLQFIFCHARFYRACLLIFAQIP